MFVSGRSTRSIHWSIKNMCPTGRLFGHLVVLLFGSIKLLVLNTNERAVGTMTDEWLLYQLCHVGQIWSSGKLIPCIYPPPGTHCKMKAFRDSLLKMYWSWWWLTVSGWGGWSNSFLFFRFLLAFFPCRNSMRPLLGLLSAAKACCPSKSYGAIPALRILVNRERIGLRISSAGQLWTPMVKKKGCRERFAAVPWHQSRTLL